MMNKVHEALFIGGALLLAHLPVCIYLFVAKERESRKRGMVLIVGNCLLLWLFYIPARLAPREYIGLFGVSFLAGFAALVQYVKWMAKQDDQRARQIESESESN